MGVAHRGRRLPRRLYGLWHGPSSARGPRCDGARRRWPRPAGEVHDHTGESPNLRRSVVDLHDEYARHVGHADLLREAIDGLVGRTRRSDGMRTSTDVRPSSTARGFRAAGQPEQLPA